MASPNHLKAEARKAKFLDIMAQNPDSTMRGICDMAAVPYETYQSWRRNDPQLKAKVDLLRAGQARGKEGLTPMGGGFLEFKERFFPHEYATPPFHLDIARIIETAKPQSVTMILVPPNFAKSTLLEDWVGYTLGKDPNHRFTIVSKSQQQARKMLGHIARRCTDVQQFSEYIARYGPFHVDGQEKMGKPWTRDYFTVARADHDERDYSLQVLGWSGQVYGSRIDTLILDDIQTRDNLSSIEEMRNKLSLEFFTRGDRDFRAFIIGTRIEVDDIYEQLERDGIIDQLYVMPAVHLGNDGEEESLWPDRWPMHILHKQRKMIGEKAWWCGYMMAPKRGGSATFTEDMLTNALNAERSFGPLQPKHLPQGVPYLPSFLSLDPALGGGNALVAAAYTSTKLYFLDCIRETGLARTEDILLRIEEFARAYRPNDLIIENVAFQRGLARDDRLQSLAGRYGFTVHEHATNRNKQDPILGVGSMAGSYLRGEIDIPDGDEYTRTRFAEFVQEHLAWRPDIATKLLTQDLVMAAWFGWLFWQNKRMLMASNMSDWDRGGLGGYTSYKPIFQPRGNAGYM